MKESNKMLFLFVLCIACLNKRYDAFPIYKSMNVPPFTRALYYVPNQLLQGNDVIIMQTLLQRFDETLIATGKFDKRTEDVLKKFQTFYRIPSDGVFNENSATVLLQKYLDDNYNGFYGKLDPKYKFLIRLPVFMNREIETWAIVYNTKMDIVYKFRARTHGQFDRKGKQLNQLSHNGNTPTGLTLVDLNSPEPDPKSFGPYPVVRLVKGLKGNSAIHQVNTSKTLLSDMRDGILIHTGEWKNWKPGYPMPNSNGCIHIEPQAMKELVEILTTKLKIEVRKNTDGKTPYPYTPQGLISIENIASPIW